MIDFLNSKVAVILLTSMGLIMLAAMYISNLVERLLVLSRKMLLKK